MARMYGKMRVFPECRYGCCIYEQDKEKSKRLETELWQKEADDELYGFERDHAHGMCSDRINGEGGCRECYIDDDTGDGWFGDLEGHEGMLYNGKPVVDPWGDLG